MKLIEEIAVVVYQKLTQSNDVVTALSGGEIAYKRADYSKPGIIIIPHSSDGEGSVREGRINVNIHVPDIHKGTASHSVYELNFQKLIQLKKMAIEVLRRHYESDEGWNWAIDQMDSPIEEQGHNEHYCTLILEVIIRDRTNKQ